VRYTQKDLPNRLLNYIIITTRDMMFGLSDFGASAAAARLQPKCEPLNEHLLRNPWATAVGPGSATAVSLMESSRCVQSTNQSSLGCNRVCVDSGGLFISPLPHARPPPACIPPMGEHGTVHTHFPFGYRHYSIKTVHFFNVLTSRNIHRQISARAISFISSSLCTTVSVSRSRSNAHNSWTLSRMNE
jgi:hypothetical protein